MMAGGNKKPNIFLLGTTFANILYFYDNKKKVFVKGDLLLTRILQNDFFVNSYLE